MRVLAPRSGKETVRKGNRVRGDVLTRIAAASGAQQKINTAKRDTRLAGAIRRWPASREELKRIARERLQIYKAELLELCEEKDDPKGWAEEVEELMRSLAPLASVFADWCILDQRWKKRDKSQRALTHLSMLFANEQEENALKKLRLGYLPDKRRPILRTFVIHRAATAIQNWAKKINREAGRKVFNKDRPVSQNEFIGHLVSVLLDVPGETLSSASLSRSLREHPLHKPHAFRD